jgi:hypothetical protein
MPGSRSHRRTPWMLALALSAGAHVVQAQGSSGPPHTPDGWVKTESRSAMTDEPTIVLTAQANDEVQGWLDRARPALTVRCKERKLDVYLVTGMSSHVESARGAHTLRYRIDTTRAVSESSWGESTDNNALFSPAPAELAERLMSGSTILFEWTPFNASPVQARFQVAGLEAHRSSLVAACPGALASTSAAERAAYAASPEGRRDEAVAAFKRLIDANPRYTDRMLVVSGVIDGLLGTRGGGSYVTTRIVAVKGCSLTVAVTHQLTNITGSDTSWVDLRTLAPSPEARALKPMAGWGAVLSTEDGAKSITTNRWMTRDRSPKVASYALLALYFDKEETAREAASLAGAAIRACRTI